MKPTFQGRFFIFVAIVVSGMKKSISNSTKRCNHTEHTAVAVCSQCGTLLCENCWHRYNGGYVCASCRSKQGIQMSRGFVYLTGIVLFFMVFSGIIVFGSKYAASESNVSDTAMSPASSYLWLTERDFSGDQSLDSSTGISQLDPVDTLSDGTVICLRPFSNLKELKQFLDDDLTNEQIYCRDFDCADFAFML